MVRIDLVTVSNTCQTVSDDSQCLTASTAGLSEELSSEQQGGALGVILRCTGVQAVVVGEVQAVVWEVQGAVGEAV